MRGDSLCQRCQWKKAWKDARDQFYHQAYLYGAKKDAADKLFLQAKTHLANAVAVEAKVQRQLKTLNELTEELRAELEPKPSWWRRLVGLLGFRTWDRQR